MHPGPVDVCVRVHDSSHCYAPLAAWFTIAARFARFPACKERASGSAEGPTPFETKRSGRLSFLAPSGEGIRRQARILESRGVSPTVARPKPGASPGFCDDWTARTLAPLAARGMPPHRAVASKPGATGKTPEISIDIALFDARPTFFPPVTRMLPCDWKRLLEAGWLLEKWGGIICGWG